MCAPFYRHSIDVEHCEDVTQELVQKSDSCSGAFTSMCKQVKFFKMVTFNGLYAANLLSHGRCDAQGKQCPGHVADALLRVMELQTKLLDCLQHSQLKGASLTHATEALGAARCNMAGQQGRPWSSDKRLVERWLSSPAFVPCPVLPYNVATFVLPLISCTWPPPCCCR